MTLQSLLNPPLAKANDHRLEWGGLIGDSACLLLSQYAKQSNHPLLLIAPDALIANQWFDIISFFSATFDFPILRFPDWETLPFDHFSPHQDIISERLLALHQLPRMRRGIMIVALSTLMHRLCPRAFLEAETFVLRVADHFPLTENRERLVHAGYRAVGQVMEHGEFAWRGAIIDIFPMGSDCPYRIELFDDEVATIRSFDVDTQRTIETFESIQLLPAHEFPLTESGIALFRSRWRSQFPGNPKQAPIYQQVSQGIAAASVEYYLPLFFEKLETLFDYLPKNTEVFQFEKSEQAAITMWHEIEQRYEERRYDITRPLCEPRQLFLTYEEIRKAINTHLQITLYQEMISKKAGHTNFGVEALPELSIDSKSEASMTRLKQYLLECEAKRIRVLICAETAGRRETLKTLMLDLDVVPVVFATWTAFIDSAVPFGIAVTPLSRGIKLVDPEIVFLTEFELFGELIRSRRAKEVKAVDPATLIRNLTELQVGDPVVHLQHGVGRYGGLQKIKTGDHEGEYLALTYADNDKIYVPVASLHLISRYSGVDHEHVPLQKLGSKQWEKIKEKTEKRIRDVAAELLDIYSRRQASEGFQFKKPDKDYERFRNAFPFEETKDQRAAIDAVIADMTTTHRMDRVVCGDVGFGKTEVAMQAAFIAVNSGKQVAVLVPTTLLAEQHEQNFQDRFADWPVRIAAISRMRSHKEQDEIIKALAAGLIDIIIGTHKLLSEDIHFKDLGLLIVDEEHRFGVRQKEKIKSLRANIDILTLTATPIPRTLSGVLSGTRDLSIIATPPAKRLSVKTFVHEYDINLIREAIRREMLRGGQIYFLHNEVSTIERVANTLQDQIPEARVLIAHGQMREKQLERAMNDFYHQKFNVLVCTTIIESGIDIPTANTIIINRADRFGLAQLHQLRGRVGRSHHQAYAYLLTPVDSVLTKDAVQRLEAIAELDELGVGFNLSTHDLEIRGAGELLGMEQSGHMHEMGFSLYMELLQEAVSALKSGREPSFDKPLKNLIEIDLGVSALFPDDYIPDPGVRLTLYKRLANATHFDAVLTLKEELIDRFGVLPKPAENLFAIALIQQQAVALGIKKIDVGPKYGYLQFVENPSVPIERLIQLIQRSPKQYQLQQDRLRFTISSDLANRVTLIENLLKILR